MIARQLPARQGVLWLIGGFMLLRRNPPFITALTFAYFLVVILINLIPTVGPFLLPLALPVLVVMLANGCRAIEQGRLPGMSVGTALTEGLAAHRLPLMRLGGVHLLASAVVALVGFGMGTKIDLSDGMNPEEAVALLGDMALLLAIASPFLMAFWFAPLLVAWDGVSTGKSVFFSFVASWRNWRPFAVYGLALGLVGVVLPGLILVIVGAISTPLLNVLSVVLRMLLLFVLAPVLMASVYLSYRDVFAAADIAEPDVVTPDE
jgi:hypothetical protein